MPIGMMPDSTYQWQRCSVARNARLYIFSDGIYEICAASQTELTVQNHQTLLGLDGFTKLMTTLESQQKLSIDTLISAVQDFGGSRFDDDLSLLEVDFQI